MYFAVSYAGQFFEHFGFDYEVSHGTKPGGILGFMLTALLYWLLTALFGQKIYIQISALILGLLLCYLCGWLWYSQFAQIRFLPWCAAYILPDAAKLALAFFLSRRLKIVT